MAEDERETDTWHERPYFKPRGRNGDGREVMLVETLEGNTLPILANGGFLMVELRQDVTRDEALELARLLNSSVEFITYTGPTRPEWVDQPGRGAMGRRNEKSGRKG